MVWSTARTGPGATRQRCGLGVVDLDPVLAQHRHGHVDVGLRRHRLAVVAGRRRPRRSERRRAAAPRRTGWSPRRRARPARPAPRRRRATVNGRPVALDAARRGRAGRRGPRRSGRVRMWGSPSKATGPSASAATGGTNRITVPASPQSTAPPPVEGAGRDPPVVPGGVDRGTERRSAPRPSAVVSRERRARRTTDGPVGERGEHQCAVGQGLAAGQRDARLAPARGRAAPATGRARSTGSPGQD